MKAQTLAYQNLNKFVGHWKTTGWIPATGTTPAIKIHGTDTYQWLPGGFFLLHTVDVYVGDDHNETTEIIGFDKQKELYTMQHYDNKGNSGVMTAVCKDDVWVFNGDNLRFTGGFKNRDKEFSGIWEQSNGKDWQHFMDIKLSKTV